MTEPFIEHMPLYEDSRGGLYVSVDNIGESAHKKIKRTYIVRNWSRGMIRAWHGHKDGWTGLHVVKGALQIVVRKMTVSSATFPSPQIGNKIFTLSDKKPGIVWIPPGYYHGHMSLEDDTRILVYSTQTFEEVKKDDVRYPWDDEDDEYFEVKIR